MEILGALKGREHRARAAERRVCELRGASGGRAAAIPRGTSTDARAPRNRLSQYIDFGQSSFLEPRRGGSGFMQAPFQGAVTPEFDDEPFSKGELEGDLSLSSQLDLRRQFTKTT